MTTQYPGGIDGYQNIRVLRDEIDEIVARDHNDLRSAVVKIEQTLGIQPQGVFGTIVARLDDAYQNIESHVAGNPPRHMDTVIESPARSGSPHFSLSAGTVGSQLAELLAYVNEPLYSGSGSKTFADGYALPASNLEQAITEIVRRLGVSTGGTAVGFSSSTTFADGSSPAGASLSAALNDAVSKLGATTGGLRIGASSFSTDRGTFSVSGTSLALQDQEIADFSDELSHLAERSLYGFVVSGMAVTRASATAVNVGTGWVAVGGRILPFSASSFTHSGAGFHRIYAKVTSGAVAIADAASDDELMGAAGNQATVPLATFTETGAAHSGFFDLRRYGMHVNNRPALTVGSDGYGADFTSLRSAIEYVSLLRSAGAGAQAANRIVLTDDITVPSGDLPLQLVDGLEIDGANHKISWGTDSPLFQGSDVSDVSLLNIRAEYTAGALGSAASLADFSITGASDSERIRVANCHATSTTADRLPYFLRYDSGGSGGLFRTFVVEGCSAQCVVSALQGSSATSAPAPYQALVRGNRFYQAAFASQPDACIRVGSFCVVEGNIVEGGYTIGIDVHVGESAVVCGNFVNGGTGIAGSSGSPIMGTGINVRTTGSGVSVRSVVSGNIVKGVTTRGIQLRSTGSAAECVASNNMIDNRWDLSATMMGIEARGVYTQTLGNYILYPGEIGIERATHAVGNVLIGSSAIPTVAAIRVESSGTNGKVISGNYMYEVRGTGIEANSSTDCLIAGNFMHAGSAVAAVTSAVANVGSRSVVSGNRIADYRGSGAAILLASGSSGTVVADNCVHGSANAGLDVNSSTDCLVSGNLFDAGAASASATSAITGVGSRSVVSGNRVEDYLGAGAALALVSASTASVVADNMLNNCSDAGIDANSATQLVVSGNVLAGSSDSDSGIANLQEFSLVSGNIVSGYGTAVGTHYGIHAAVSSGKMTIAGNLLRSPGANIAAGIFLNTDIVYIVSENTILDGHPVGIDMNGSGSSLVIGNMLAGNASSVTGVADVGAMSLVSGNFVSAYGNSSGYGILMNSSTHKSTAIAHNVIVNPAAAMVAGIGLQSLNSELAVLGNVIGGTGAGITLIGIEMGDADRVVVAGNLITGAGVFDASGGGIMSVGNYCVVTGNYISDPSNIGIELADDQAMAIGNIIVSSTSNGITAADLYQTVIGNHIYSPAGYGIRAFASTGNSLFASNYVWQDSSGGIISEGGNNNFIVGNYFLSTTGIAIDLDGTGNDGSAVVGNYINGVSSITTVGINVDGGSSGVFVSGNYVDDPSGNGITCASTECAIVNNYVVSPGSNGIATSGTATAAFIAGNYIEGVTADGIDLQGAAGGAVVGNYINGCVNGIQTFSSSSPLLVQGNMINNHTGDAIEASGAPDQSFVGNMNANPGVSSDGIGMTSTADSLCVGNRMTAQTGQTGFDFSASQVTIVGNLASGGNTPTGFGTAHSTVGSNRLP